MMTYVLLGVPFMAMALVVAYTSEWRPDRRWLFGLSLLLILTAVFDSMIIGFEVVGYDRAKILGAYIGQAPIEDFLYAIAAAVLVPALWHILAPKKDKRL